ncbi:hypothetical protein BDV59DRAFT_171555 [Aspergillus ambiguus]|uniref:uncharacterized protein n=1 Tax=Aspergillus ambiguus TaxID=176160 RepID=UPI003CCCF40C
MRNSSILSSLFLSFLLLYLSPLPSILSLRILTHPQCLNAIDRCSLFVFRYTGECPMRLRCLHPASPASCRTNAQCPVKENRNGKIYSTSHSNHWLAG